MLLVFYGAGREPDGAAKLIEVHVMVSGSYIVAIRHTGCSEIDDLRRRISAKPDASEQYIVYSVLDTLTDTFFPVLAAICLAFSSATRPAAKSPLSHIP